LIGGLDAVQLQSGDRLHLDKERLLDEPVDH
jgi:hypothetical protein